MIVRPVSDIHSEMWDENPRKAIRLVDRLIPPLPDDKETVLLLPGDTGSHGRRNLYKAVVDHLCDRFLLVADIPGNHFWYGGAGWSECVAPTERSNYVFGQTFASDGIVAATLWADFQRGNPIVEEACRTSMNDFKQIHGITIDGVKERHAAHVDFLRANITLGCIVMTHFAPSWRSIHAEFQTDQRNGYYASMLDEMVEEMGAALWCHGHLHNRVDYQIGKTRVVCNPVGYNGKDHDPALGIEIV